jgi:hypothetical protein
MSTALADPTNWLQQHRHIILWHGCCRWDAVAIIRDGVDPTRGDPKSDFGRGFYTTTLREQARKWAWLRHLRSPQPRGNWPVTLRFQIPLDRLAELSSLIFVTEIGESGRYWSFVHHCRKSDPSQKPPRIHDHLHPTRTGRWYDSGNSVS